jgi:hypothetical protein
VKRLAPILYGGKYTQCTAKRNNIASQKGRTKPVSTVLTAHTQRERMRLAHVDETKHLDGSPSVGDTATSKIGRFEPVQLLPGMRMATPNPLPLWLKVHTVQPQGAYGSPHLPPLPLRQDGQGLRLAHRETRGHAAASKSNGSPSIRPAPPKTPHPYGGEYT